MQVKDFLGNPVTVGCQIVYPARQGSSMWLNRLKVTEVLPNRVSGYNPDGRYIHIKNLKNIVVVNAVPANEEAAAPQGMDG